METWTRELELPASPRSVPAARAFVRDCLVAAGLPGLVEDARLLTSELASNAVEHARTPFRVTVDYKAGRLRLSVHDGVVTPPGRSWADPFAERGRGLLLVEVLSSDWGCSPHPDGGKAVWAVLSVDSGGELGDFPLGGEEGRDAEASRPSEPASGVDRET
jgi:anti-sigma regulatory factor (Ser/Thr protein kinase)